MFTHRLMALLYFAPVTPVHDGIANTKRGQAITDDFWFRLYGVVVPSGTLCYPRMTALRVQADEQKSHVLLCRSHSVA